MAARDVDPNDGVRLELVAVPERLERALVIPRRKAIDAAIELHAALSRRFAHGQRRR